VNPSSRPTTVPFQASSPPGMAAPDVVSPAERQPENPLWVDLTPLHSTALSTVQERYGLPPEAMTYFLLHYQSAKLIHAGPALFLVTFLAVPSLRHLFITRELKVCVTPTQIVTLCGPSRKARSDLARMLPQLPSLSAGGAGQFLCGLLAGVVGSYEALVKGVEARGLDEASKEEQQRWQTRVEKLIRFLRDAQAFLGNVARGGGKVLTAEENQQLTRLEERVGVLARVAWEALRGGEGRKTSPESVPLTHQGGDA
jgi:Mg2+ and Co2+ transporter CorA